MTRGDTGQTEPIEPSLGVVEAGEEASVMAVVLCAEASELGPDAGRHAFGIELLGNSLETLFQAMKVRSCWGPGLRPGGGAYEERRKHHREYRPAPDALHTHHSHTCFSRKPST